MFVPITSAVAADDSKAQWHLYTGYQNTWVAVSPQAHLPSGQLGNAIPDFVALKNGALKWKPLPAGMDAHVSELGSINGRKLWQVVYQHDDQKGLPSSVVFWLADDQTSKTALPFFAYDFDPVTEKNWGSQLVPAGDKGTALKVSIGLRGQDQVHGSYLFDFPHGLPHFVRFSEGATE